MTEHHASQRTLRMLGSITDRLKQGTRVSTDDLSAIVEFVRVLGGRCHRAKEGDLLFPALGAGRRAA